MILPKIGIYKHILLDNRGHFRFYPADYNRKKHKHLSKENRPKLPVLNLRDLNVKTEKELLKIIQKKWGNGIYKIAAYVKGRRGLWTFWYGEIDSEGFRFFRRDENLNNKEKVKEIMELKEIRHEEELSGDYEGSKETKELIDDSNNYYKTRNKNKRYGFFPYLKSSGRRGYHVLWTDKDYMEKDKSQNWGLNKTKDNIPKEEYWGENKKKEFEEW